ncbi:hypothetical protein K505DRAFT_367482 [Melanomma pulvis-pyrius CBS 109.77]|uniref:Uncharacterized protein n=1 Tax=Melanomma pulvis-pyrius CBS 109.77 TaxID=1314802 RepID=A0A6A6WT82_9PLEO|nr:hypothetical protein K505DRAFT_367482 [Melanomma pulvis-pyrius CBS 109.77]
MAPSTTDSSGPPTNKDAGISSPLMNLPGELRNRIYQEIVGDRIFYVVDSNESEEWVSPVPLTLQLVNKQLEQELSGYILWAIENKKWTFTSGTILSSVLATTPAPLLDQIKTLRLELSNRQYLRFWGDPPALAESLIREFNKGPHFDRLNNLERLELDFRLIQPDDDDDFDWLGFHDSMVRSILRVAIPRCKGETVVTLTGDVSRATQEWAAEEWSCASYEDSITT